MQSLPKEYNALVRKDDDAKEKLMDTFQMPETVPEGEVLVKMSYSPINPADMMVFLYNNYGHREQIKKAPIVAGFEGSGVIVKVAPNGDQSQVGKKVAVMQNIYSQDFRGTWRQYSLYQISDVIVFPDDANLEKIHSPFVNPLTAFSMAQESLEKKFSAVIFNAAGSSLCRMCAPLFAKEGIKTIMIVRREEHLQELLQRGATVVLNSKCPNFEQDLTKAIKDLKPQGFFDAVAGPDAVDILKKMPDFSTLYNYGALSMKGFDGVTPFDTIFHRKTITGFWLNDQAPKMIGNGKIKNFFALLVKDLSYDNGKLFGTTNGKTYDLKDWETAFSDYKKGNAKKMLFKMN